MTASGFVLLLPRPSPRETQLGALKIYLVVFIFDRKSTATTMQENFVACCRWHADAIDTSRGCEGISVGCDLVPVDVFLGCNRRFVDLNVCLWMS